MGIIDELRLELENTDYKIGMYRRILEGMQADRGKLLQKRPNEYYITEDGKAVYAGKSAKKRVEDLKLRRYLNTAVKILEGNRKILISTMEEWKPYDYEAVNAQLPKTYRGAFVPAAETYYINQVPLFTPSENPFYPEELIHTASFGLKVRTKGEMIIAELLYNLGIPFCYEKELYLYDEEGHLKVVYPDFSIWADDEWFFIEHLGRMDLESYRQRNVEKMFYYHYNGILMPGQLIFTMDGPDGDLDAGPIRNFLENIILPRIRQAVPAG